MTNTSVQLLYTFIPVQVIVVPDHTSIAVHDLAWLPVVSSNPGSHVYITTSLKPYNSLSGYFAESVTSTATHVIADVENISYP